MTIALMVFIFVLRLFCRKHYSDVNVPYDNSYTFPSRSYGLLVRRADQARHRKTESRLVISIQASPAVARRNRKKRAAVPFFHVARSTWRAQCLFATMRNLAASSNVGFAALPPLT